MQFLVHRCNRSRNNYVKLHKTDVATCDSRGLHSIAQNIHIHFNNGYTQRQILHANYTRSGLNL